ncbi:hypothetical protein [Ferviditalea candida]|uniref:DUF4129 domain-containing protein n=1 Tax=Ferviditalea candida TaxID=3108399 RepID=A0ABU5ZR60_9BACL|nr:hypothetical protein [Paenibacillaceae bacterium T2]
MDNRFRLDEDREKLRQILFGEEFTAYHQERANVSDAWLEKLGEWLAKWFPKASIPGGTARTVSYGIIILVIALLLMLIVWYTLQIIRQRKLKKRMLICDEDMQKPYSFFLDQAKALAEKKDVREAIRHAFLALLFYLEHRECVKVERWKTNWEYVRELRENRGGGGMGSRIPAGGRLFSNGYGTAGRPRMKASFIGISMISHR